MVFLLCKIIHVLLTSCGVVSRDSVVSDKLIMGSAVILALLTFLTFHLILSFFGY